MKVYTCLEPGTLVQGEASLPIPAHNESLVKIERVGICGTDLHAYAGNQAFFTYPRVLGHELAGKIIEMNGAYQGLAVGQEVVIIPYLHCGSCGACRQGKTNCCSSLDVLGVHIDGGMCEYISLPTELLLPAEGLTVDEMAIVEPLCIGTHAVRRVPIGQGDWVAVSGCGPIGVGIIWAAKMQGAKVMALDVDKHRLAFAQDKLGVEAIIDASKDPMSAIKDLTNGEMVSVAFDATGAKVPMEGGVDYVGSGGSYVLVGLNKGNLSFHHPDLHRRELAVVCSRNATRKDFALVISRLQGGHFPTDDYISHRAPAADLPHSFEFWKDPANKVMKAMTVW